MVCVLAVIVVEFRGSWRRAGDTYKDLSGSQDLVIMMARPTPFLIHETMTTIMSLRPILDFLLARDYGDDSHGLEMMQQKNIFSRMW